MNFYIELRAALFAASLGDQRAARAALVERMAADLVAEQAFANEREAIRVLMWKGYCSLDIALLTDDVRQMAMQSVVAREMAKR